MSRTVTISDTTSPVGSSVPPFTDHAISVSLPTWQDTVGYEEGEKRVVDSMVTGYPRFFIHFSIQKLVRVCEQKFGVPDERCMLFPTKKIADHCRSFMHDQSKAGSPAHVRLVHLLLCPEDRQPVDHSGTEHPAPSKAGVDLHVVLFPADSYPLARLFWQHSGLGISSRLAEHCLSMLPNEPVSHRPNSPTMNRFPSKGLNKHYSNPSSPKRDSFPSGSQVILRAVKPEGMTSDQDVYLEERYGRNLPLASAPYAKAAIRRRIAGVLVRDDPDDSVGEQPLVGSHDVEVGPSSRGVAGVTENDVFLFPTGMSAIWNAHHLVSSVRPQAKSVCFGFPYTDTLKIIQKWGPGCHFFGNGLDADIDDLESLLEKEASSGSPPIQALFTEFPSNPLLRCANLPGLRALADKYDFLLIIDETIGNFVNVEVMPYADILVSSLSKIFSGDANVMGGSLVLNPLGRHYKELKAHMAVSYEDTYFDGDAIYLERNSRNFKRRIQVIDSNTEAVCDLLRSRSVAGHAPSAVIQEVFYPKWISRENYEHCRIKGSGEAGEGGGFGGLFSLTFTSTAASQAFFDTLPCYKGPSLGTNFTLACPYVVLAHYAEMEWAAQFGVEESLVRISVGMEERTSLLSSFRVALDAAEATAKQV